MIDLLKLISILALEMLICIKMCNSLTRQSNIEAVEGYYP